MVENLCKILDFSLPPVKIRGGLGKMSKRIKQVQPMDPTFDILLLGRRCEGGKVELLIVNRGQR